jgi:hypothetical protein
MWNGQITADNMLLCCWNACNQCDEVTEGAGIHRCYSNIERGIHKSRQTGPIGFKRPPIDLYILPISHAFYDVQTYLIVLWAVYLAQIRRTSKFSRHCRFQTVWSWIVGQPVNLVGVMASMGLKTFPWTPSRVAWPRLAMKTEPLLHIALREYAPLEPLGFSQVPASEMYSLLRTHSICARSQGGFQKLRELLEVFKLLASVLL